MPIGGIMPKSVKSICRNCKFVRRIVVLNGRDIYKCRIKITRRIDPIVKLKNECDINHFEKSVS